jgi:hypothetical protein
MIHEIYFLKKIRGCYFYQFKVKVKFGNLDADLHQTAACDISLNLALK